MFPFRYYEPLYTAISFSLIMHENILDWLLVAGLVTLTLWFALWIRDAAIPYIKRVLA